MSGWLLWPLRLAPAALLLWAGINKLLGGPFERSVFAELGMEPHGRILIALIECAAALLLLSPQAATGALLALGVMLGAAIAHTTVIGADVGHDGGLHLALLAGITAASTIVLLARRAELPFVGKTLDRS